MRESNERPSWGGVVRAASPAKYDIINAEGNRVFTDMVYDAQCDTYYSATSLHTIRGDHVINNNWEVIETGYYTEG